MTEETENKGVSIHIRVIVILALAVVEFGFVAPYLFSAKSDVLPWLGVVSVLLVLFAIVKLVKPLFKTLEEML